MPLHPLFCRNPACTSDQPMAVIITSPALKFEPLKAFALLRHSQPVPTRTSKVIHRCGACQSVRTVTVNTAALKAD